MILITGLPYKTTKTKVLSKDLSIDETNEEFMKRIQMFLDSERIIKVISFNFTPSLRECLIVYRCYKNKGVNRQ